MLVRSCYDSAYCPSTGSHQYKYWDLGENVTLSCKIPFKRGDLLAITDVDSLSSTISVDKIESGYSERVLMFLSPRIPLSDSHRFVATPRGCEIVLERRVSNNGNSSIISAVVASSVDKSVISYKDSDSKAEFKYFIFNPNGN